MVLLSSSTCFVFIWNMPALRAQECTSQPIIAGYRDLSYDAGDVTREPTEEKPESKLWHNDGVWWGVLWDVQTTKYRIHRFDVANQCWIDVGPDVDERPRSSADVLWDGEHLYIASHAKLTHNGESAEGRIYRYSYDSTSRSYSLDNDFPVTVNFEKSRALILAKDSTGQLWVTWTANNKVMVNRTFGNDLTWGIPFELPVQGNDIDDLDISSIVTFGGDKIGILWSNQRDEKYYFAVHLDHKADNEWEPRETALADDDFGNVADDHINLTTGPENNIVLAAVKTSINGAENPQVFVIKRNPTNGTWTRHVFGVGSEDHTRPIILVDSEHDSVYVIAPSDKFRDKAIYMKSAHLSDLQFPSGLGRVFLKSAAHSEINNPTSTKQNVNAETGLLVLASDKTAKRYMHGYLALTGNTRPVAMNDSVTVDINMTVQVDVTANDLDSDGIIIPSTVAIVQQARHGSTSVDSETGLVTYIPDTTFSGLDQFMYSVEDDNGARSNAAAVAVKVQNPPVAVDDTVTTEEDTSVDIDVTANDHDLDGTIQAATVTVVNAPKKGITSLKPETGVITYTPNADFFGGDTLSYTVKDDDNSSSNEATITVSVLPVNDPPVAVNDTITTKEGTAVDIDVTANDGDIDGTIDLRTISLLDSTRHGTAIIDTATGLITYTPDSGFLGADSFQYSVKDNEGALSNAAQVTVNVNTPPIAKEDNYTLDEDMTLNLPPPGVLSNDTDANGDPIVAELVAGVSHGSLALNANGSLTYEPNSNFHGLDTFTYIASDGISQSAEVPVLITINPINDRPVALGDNYLVEENSILRWPSPGVLANDTDVEGDSLSSVLVNAPVHGNLNLNADGSFSYTPNLDFVGSDSFTYRANDGDEESQMATVAITVISTGTTLWPARFEGPGDGADRAVDVVVNSEGAVYVCGWSFSADKDFDFVTLKYTPNGTPLWIQRFNGEGRGEDQPAAMALDADSAVYVVGKSLNSMGDFDYMLLKYDANGNFLWKQRYNGPGNGDDAATALAVDQFGEVYITGESWSTDSGFDYLTLKYDTNGNLLWQQRYNGADNGDDKAAALELDSAGNIFVTGKSWGSETGFDYLTVKYDSDGALLWEQRYNGPGNDDDEATVIASDSESNVYVTGSSWGLGTDFDYATLKYDANGEFRWLQRFNGPGNGEDRATDLVLDSSDNLYVTGQSWDTDEGFGYTTLRYLPGDGTPRWFQRYDGASADDDKPMGLTVDPTSNICVTGLSDGDYGTLKYDPQGSLIWEQRYDGPQNGFDQATAMVVDSLGNIYVTGGSENLDTAEDFATVKYTPFATSVAERYPGAKPEIFELEQNYPNPFNASTTIAFSLSRSGHVRLIIFDLLGKKVTTLADEKFGAGRHKINWDATGLPSGTYFYRIKMKELTKTRKLILLQ